MAGQYTYNPACHCDWCRNDGNIPSGTPDNGHAFGYEHPHIPPTSIRFMGSDTTGQQERMAA